MVAITTARAKRVDIVFLRIDLRITNLPSRTSSRNYKTFFGRTKRPARSARRPMIAPVTTPTTGPTRAIINLGEFGSGIEPIIAASLGWWRSKVRKKMMGALVTQTLSHNTKRRQRKKWRRDRKQANKNAQKTKIPNKKTGSTSDEMADTVPPAIAKPKNERVKTPRQ